MVQLLLIVSFLTIGFSEEKEDKSYILESKRDGILIKYDSKEKLTIISPHYSTTISYSECSSWSIHYFIRELERANSKTIPLKIEGSYVVTINEKQKYIFPRSLLGRFLNGIPSEALTLDTEVALSCNG